jgi:ATP-binding cassette subfamily B protein
LHAFLHIFFIIQAPILSSFYFLIFSYSTKLLIDAFSQNSFITFESALRPILWFIFAQILHDFCWRMHNFACWKSQPYIRQAIIVQAYKIISSQTDPILIHIHIDIVK